MRLRRSIVHASLAVALLASLPAAGDYKESYKQGVQAMDLGDWKAAITHFERARKERPQAGGQVRFPGMRVEEYTPYFHLGRAYDKVGNTAKALEMLELSRTQNVIKAGSRPGKERAKMLARLESLKPKVKQVPEAIMADARGKVRSTSDLETELREKMKGPGFEALAKSDPQLTDGLDKLFADRTEIATRLAKAKTESDYKSVGQEADELGQRLEIAGVNLDKGLETIGSNRLAAATEITVRKISEAKKSGGKLTAQRDQALKKDSTLLGKWSSTDRTLTEAEELYAKGSKSGSLPQIERAGKLADQVIADRTNLVAQVDRKLKQDNQAQEHDRLVRLANQEIDQQEGESKKLLADADQVDSPGSEVTSRRASVDRALRERPAADASLKELNSHVTRLRSENTRLGSAMTSDLLAQDAQVESAGADARGALARAAKVDSPSPELRLGIEVVNKLLAEQTPGDGYLTRLRQAVDDLDVAMVPSSIDQRLAKAYQAYAKCDYDGVETTLAGATFDKPWLDVQANLFRAAALFARYVHGGEQDDSLRERARHAVEECLRLDPDYLPREEVFTSPFLAFYRES